MVQKFPWKRRVSGSLQTKLELFKAIDFLRHGENDR